MIISLLAQAAEVAGNALTGENPVLTPLATEAADEISLWSMAAKGGWIMIEAGTDAAGVYVHPL